MGTRGLVGIRYKGRTYYFYNHSDSYPDGLGAAIVRELMTLDVEAFLKILDGLFIVTKDVDVEEAIRRLETSGVTFDSSYLLTKLVEKPVFVALGMLGPHAQDVDLSSLGNDHKTIGDAARKRQVKTRNELEALISYGGILGWDTRCNPPFGPLARFTRLGVCVPSRVVDGDDRKDHRDIFIEWTYLIDFDKKTLATSGVKGTLPFSKLISETAYEDYIEAHS